MICLSNLQIHDANYSISRKWNGIGYIYLEWGAQCKMIPKLISTKSNSKFAHKTASHLQLRVKLNLPFCWNTPSCMHAWTCPASICMPSCFSSNILVHVLCITIASHSGFTWHCICIHNSSDKNCCVACPLSHTPHLPWCRQS